MNKLIVMATLAAFAFGAVAGETDGARTAVDAFSKTKGACGGVDFWGNCWGWTATRRVLLAAHVSERGMAEAGRLTAGGRVIRMRAYGFGGNRGIPGVSPKIRDKCVRVVREDR